MASGQLLVHRLDRDTSGVLLCAKSRKMAADLGAIFRARETRKIYWAVVEGVPSLRKEEFRCFSPRARAWATSAAAKGGRVDLERMRVARHGDPDAQHSLTMYATIDKVLPRLAWLSLRPITGRTHQLRAHCEPSATPLSATPNTIAAPTNDPARKIRCAPLPSGIEPKLHLFARRLVLPHPRGGVIDVTAPVPEHMQKTFDMFGFAPAAARSDFGRPR